MLKKLLKYDLKWCYKALVVFYILAIFFAVITRIVESFEQTLIVLIIDKICSGIVIAMLINILINCFMRNWVRFIRNVYKDESYLTHTLPVSKNAIYLSKILTNIITLFTSFVVIIACISIVCLNETTWFAFKTLIEQSAISLNSSVASFIIVIIATTFFEVLFMQMCGILGIIIGHKSNNLKIVKSIIIGFVIYITFSTVSLTMLYVAGLLNPDIMSIFNNVQVSSNSMKGMMLIAMFIYAVYILISYFIGNKLLSKGVNVD